MAYEEVIEDKFKLKEQSEHACERCGSYKYTQKFSEKIGVICKECLGKTLDSALNETLEKLDIKHRV